MSTTAFHKNHHWILRESNLRLIILKAPGYTSKECWGESFLFFIFHFGNKLYRCACTSCFPPSRGLDLFEKKNPLKKWLLVQDFVHRETNKLKWSRNMQKDKQSEWERVCGLISNAAHVHTVTKSNYCHCGDSGRKVIYTTLINSECTLFDQICTLSWSEWSI